MFARDSPSSARRSHARLSYPEPPSSAAATGSILPPIFAAQPAHHASGTRATHRSSAARGNSPRRHAPRKAPLPHIARARDSDSVTTARGNGTERVVYARGGGGGQSGSQSARGATGASSNRSSRPPLSTDDATIGPDGTVTFGPHLSLLMASLALRFDTEPDESGGGGAHSQHHDRHSSSDPDDRQYSSRRPKKSTAASRKKQQECNTMSELFQRAMREKTALRHGGAAAGSGGTAGGLGSSSNLEAQREAQWFRARFNYPILHQPQQPLLQQQQPSSGARSFNPIANYSPASPSSSHAHLLHSNSSASRSQLQSTAELHGRGVAVEEEKDGEELQE